MLCAANNDGVLVQRGSSRDNCAAQISFEENKKKISANQSSWFENYIREVGRVLKTVDKSLVVLEGSLVIGAYLATDEELKTAVKNGIEEAAKGEFSVANVLYLTFPQKNLEAATNQTLNQMKRVTTFADALSSISHAIGSVADMHELIYPMPTPPKPADVIVKAAEQDEKGMEPLEMVAIAIDKAGPIARRIKEKKEYMSAQVSSHHKKVAIWAGPAILGILLGAPVMTAIGAGVGALFLASKMVDWMATVEEKKQMHIGAVTLQTLYKTFRHVVAEIKLDPTIVRQLIANVTVGFISSYWVLNVEDKKNVQVVQDHYCKVIKYFMYYSATSYCLKELNSVEDRVDCQHYWAQIDKRTRYISKFAALEGFKNNTVTYFVAFDMAINAIVVAFQGTVDFNDILIDARANLVNFSFGTVDGKAHAGMLKVATNITKQIKRDLAASDFKDFAKQLPIVFTGHSLGGGIAALCTLLFKQAGYLAFGIGVATPAVLSPSIATIMSSFFVTVINNADIVPRASERAVCQLAGKLHSCNIIEEKDSLMTPGTLYWMRKASYQNPPVDKMEITRILPQNVVAFAQTIILAPSLGEDHSVKLYIASMEQIYSDNPYDGDDIDISMLIRDFPKERGYEPEFVFAILTPQFEKALKTWCRGERQITIKAVADKSEKEAALKVEIEKIRGEKDKLQRALELERANSREQCKVRLSRQEKRKKMLTSLSEQEVMQQNQTLTAELTQLQTNFKQILTKEIFLARTECEREKNKVEASIRAECEKEKAQISKAKK